jgi:hypothetical protein
MKDAFDQFWEWADKRFESPLTIPNDLHYVVTELLNEGERHDRETVNKAVESLPERKRPDATEVAPGPYLVKSALHEDYSQWQVE